jgi:hypothetical protein
MTTIGLLVLIVVLAAYLYHTNARLNKEIKRSRMHQAFTAGIIRALTDYHSRTDGDEFEIPDRPTRMPIPYPLMLENIDWELSKDLLMANYETWLKNDRNIFFDEETYGDDGFNFMYLDLFDKKLNKWHSNELLSPRMKEWLSKEVEVTPHNVGELEGEIGMLRDLMKSKLSCDGFSQENIDRKFALMFNHIRADRLEEAKNLILDKLKGTSSANTTKATG